jgi:hypothetical protein
LLAEILFNACIAAATWQAITRTTRHPDLEGLIIWAAILTPIAIPAILTFESASLSDFLQQRSVRARIAAVAVLALPFAIFRSEHEWSSDPFVNAVLVSSSHHVGVGIFAAAVLFEVAVFVAAFEAAWHLGRNSTARALYFFALSAVVDVSLFFVR